MTARAYDIYDLNSPFVTPNTPTAPAAAPTAKRTAARLLRGSAYLAVLTGLLLLAAALVALTPLGRIDADITVPFVAALLTALAAIVWGTVRK